MNTIKKLLKSRTTYTIIALAIVNTVPDIKSILPAEMLPYANMSLTIATLYFKFNPSQEYAQSNQSKS